MATATKHMVMGLDKIVNAAKKLANDPKVQEHLKSERAEQISDSVLDKAAGAANSVTGGKHEEKITRARDAADRAIGTDGDPDQRGDSAPRR